MTESGTGDAAATTGAPRVDDALRTLDGLEHLDLPAQLDVFTELQEALALILDSPEYDEGESEVQVDESAAHSPAS